MEDRLNLGCEVRELKLGSTFYSQNPRSSFHTLKYDFKPASVDLSKIASLDVSSNNQVTVTVPHLDGSGVPKTVFKGNQRNYTKECVLIIDKTTGAVTLEKLHHNIQVKKTRSELVAAAKPAPSMPSNKGLENSTQRTMSKTKVSTGIRKTPISANFINARHSPLQASPSYPHHKSPQQTAPLWHANNVQSTLPSIPIIGMDDDDDHNTIMPEPPTQLPPQQQHQQQQQQQILPTAPIMLQNHHQHLQQPSHLLTTSSSSSMPSILQPERPLNILDNDIGVLSSTDSSSDSESSGSGSDSDSPSNSPSKSAHSLGVNSATHLLSEDLCLSDSASDSDSD